MPTQAEIANHLFMGVTRLQQYEAAGVLPRGAPLDEYREKYIRHLRARKAGHKSDERERLDAARAKLAELDYRVRTGEVVEAASVESMLISMTTVASSRLQALGAQLGPELAAETQAIACQKLIDAGIADALRELIEAGSRARELYEESEIERLEPAVFGPPRLDDEEADEEG